MLPVKQTIMHDPSNGQYGDCHRAAIATILSLPIGEVPHFCPGPDDGKFRERETDFLKQHGLVPINVLFPGNLDLQLILNTIGNMNPDTPYLLGGESKTGCGHTVVCLNNQIVWDPSPVDSGIVGPLELEIGDHYWITFIGQQLSINM